MRGVEEVHPVLDEDATARLDVPEPVAAREALVAGVVLEREPLDRPEQLVAQHGERVQQRVVAQHVVDHEDAAGPCSECRQVARLGELGRQRLLAEDVLARGQRGAGDRCVAARRRGDRDHVDRRVVEQVAQAAGWSHRVRVGEPCRGSRVGVGDSSQRKAGDVVRGGGEEVREPAGADEPEAEDPVVTGHACSSRATPIFESAMP